MRRTRGEKREEIVSIQVMGSYHYPLFLFIIRAEAYDNKDIMMIRKEKKQKSGRESLRLPNALERKQKCTNGK